MYLLLLLGVLMAFSGDLIAVPATVRPLACVILTLALVGLNWLHAEAAAWTAARRLRQEPESLGAILRSYQRQRVIHGGLLLVSYGALVFGLRWPAVVREAWGLGRWVLIDDLLVLTPLLAGMALSWLAHYRVVWGVRHGAADLSAATDSPPYTRGMHFEFLLRHQLGVLLVPLVLLITIEDVVSLLATGTRWQMAFEVASGAIGLGLVIVAGPLLLRVLWQAQPLEQGVLRDRLEMLAHRVGFRASNILVWNTRNTMVNAAVTGLFPWLRYVFFSDALLKQLSDDEIESVFGHEVGHIRHHHLTFYIGFLLGATCMFAALTACLPGLWPSGPLESFSEWARWGGQWLIVFGGMAAYVGGFFGVLSRRFERQADLFACRVASCGRADCPPHDGDESASTRIPRTLCPVSVHTFVSALERVASLNGISRDLPSWRHFSIARRVEFVESVLHEPQRARRLEWAVIRLKLTVILILAASTGLFGLICRQG